MPGAEFRELEKYGRVTLYAAQKERKELLRKLMRQAKGKTLSEAVFQALAVYLEQVEKESKDQLLARSKGIWADNPDIDKALSELERVWSEWQNKL